MVEFGSESLRRKWYTLKQVCIHWHKVILGTAIRIRTFPKLSSTTFKFMFLVIVADLVHERGFCFRLFLSSSRAYSGNRIIFEKNTKNKFSSLFV